MNKRHPLDIFAAAKTIIAGFSERSASAPRDDLSIASLLAPDIPTLHDSLDTDTGIAGGLAQPGPEATYDELKAYAERLSEEIASPSYSGLEHSQVADILLQETALPDPVFELAATLDRLSNHPGNPDNASVPTLMPTPGAQS